jgi:hypothetical protein
MLIFDSSRIEIWNDGPCFAMNVLTGGIIFLLMAVPVTAVMLLGAAWADDDDLIKFCVIDNFANDFGLHSGHRSRVHKTEMDDARK